MKPRLLFAISALGLALPVIAADWTLIVKDSTRFVEIDRDSVLQSDPGTKVAWGRIRLSSEDAEEAGYAIVKALNRYDCRQRSFFTVKRVQCRRAPVARGVQAAGGARPGQHGQRGRAGCCRPA